MARTGKAKKGEEPKTALFKVSFLLGKGKVTQYIEAPSVKEAVTTLRRARDWSPMIGVKAKVCKNEGLREHFRRQREERAA